MAGELSPEFVALKEVARCDAALARMVAQRKTSENDIQKLRNLAEQAERERAQRAKVLADKQERVRREEHRIRDERERLVARRKALGSLNNYKVQQAAEREIEVGSRQLNAQEEALLSVMGEVEGLAKGLASFDEDNKVKHAALGAAEKEHAELVKTIERNRADYEQQRKEAVKSVNEANLKQYERIRDRYPVDPIVELQGSSCAACYMTVPPQVINQVSASAVLVRCPGCGRLLMKSAAVEKAA